MADTDNLPVHIAIIMDGNGRWAQKRGLPRTAGHRAGAEAVREIVSECRRIGIRFLTLYAFSSENWKRPKTEIAALFALLMEFLSRETPEMVKKGIALNVLGDLDDMPAPQRMALRHGINSTSACSDMVLNLAINYGARAEIVRAAKKLVASGMAPAAITESAFASQLYTGGQPDPDLLIRTSGEERLSNFLLYQAAYSELYFTPTLWPDFNAEELARALKAYETRSRRFGSAGNCSPPSGE